MLDIKQIRRNPIEIEQALQKRDRSISLTRLLESDRQVRQLKQSLHNLQRERNQHAKKIAQIKMQGQAEESQLLEQLISKGEELLNAMKRVQSELRIQEAALQKELLALPNCPCDTLIVSQDPADNRVLKTFGQIKQFPFTPKTHLELGESLQLFDFKRGVKLAGRGWVAYRGKGALLERALINLMLDLHIRDGFELWMLPLLAREEILHGSGQLPKFRDQLFTIPSKPSSLYLIPTAEVALNGLHQEETIPASELPKTYVAYTPCFRREAGAAGMQERGLIRTHQFNKVELFALTKPTESEAVLTQLQKQAEKVLETLGLHYRSLELVTGEISFSAAKTIDLEIHIPTQDNYYEVGSISNCTDFQSRRASIHFEENGKKAGWLHTLNGSGLATSRLMPALLETNQQADGSVVIPEPLRPYMGGQEKLSP